jgi:TatA/E family protein of Tat protein translocase
MGIENPLHLLFIAVVALVVLGPKRLPELARALGKGVREFREAINAGSAEREATLDGHQRVDGEAPHEHDAAER